MTDREHAERRRALLRTLGAGLGIDVDREEPPPTVRHQVLALTPAVEHAATVHALGDPYAVRWLQLSLLYAAHVMGEFAEAADADIAARASALDPQDFTR